MPTANNFRPRLHRKQWASCSPPLAATTTAGVSGIKSRLANQLFYLLRGTANLDVYDPFQDAWGSTPTPGLGASPPRRPRPLRRVE